MITATKLTETSEIAGKRDSILNASLSLFTERGFHGTAIPLVAERAEVGAGTIYRYFDSKEALVNTIYRDWKEFQLATILKDVPEDTPLREQFHIYWDRLIAFATNYPTAFSFLELHFHAPYLDEESRAVEERGHNSLVGFFHDCLHQQMVKELPAELLGAIVWGAYVGLIKATQVCGLTLSDDMIQKAEACCWEAIRR